MEVRLYRLLERALKNQGPGSSFVLSIFLMEKSFNPLDLTFPMSKIRRLPSYICDSIWNTKFGKVIQEINIGVIIRTLTFVLIILKERKLTKADPQLIYENNPNYLELDLPSIRVLL